MTTEQMLVRVEKDLLGVRDVPSSSLWGVHTLRAVENFQVGAERLSDYPDLIRALGQVKKASALANAELGILPPGIVDAILMACDRVIEGEFDDQFPLKMIQGGAGTSTNMNANEVIANAALEILGEDRGRYDLVHPNEHVNLSQSTNDVYPTALKIASIMMSRELLVAMQELRAALMSRADRFKDIVKVGRTQLQDAVPMTLGQEFGAYEVTLREDAARLCQVLARLHEINLGATAIGTGVNAPPNYAAIVRKHLEQITELPLTTAPDLIEATQDCGAFVLLSGTLKLTAIKLSKICNDLRLLSSGPRAGFGEITLPPKQAGSSIMPGKVNPVIPEMVNQVAFEVIGADVTISMAAEAGQLQLNAFEPVIANALFRSIRNLTVGMRALAFDCVNGIEANQAHLREQVDNSIGTVTALSPLIGYDHASQVAITAHETGRPLIDVVVEAGLLTRPEIEKIMRAHGW